MRTKLILVDAIALELDGCAFGANMVMRRTCGQGRSFDRETTRLPGTPRSNGRRYLRVAPERLHVACRSGQVRAVTHCDYNVVGASAVTFPPESTMTTSIDLPTTGRAEPAGLHANSRRNLGERRVKT
jgi:hypothetical protein